MNHLTTRCLRPRLLKVNMSATPDCIEFNPYTGKFEKQNRFPTYIKSDCGRCINCLRKRSLQKAARLHIDTLDHPGSMVVMVTLTFAGKVPPSKVKLDSPKPDGSVFEYPRYKCVQDFHKRLRKYGLKFGFLSCEEVGDLGRGHFHELMVIYNPEILPTFSPSEFTSFQKEFVKTRQQKLDFKHDIPAPIPTAKKFKGKNILRNPSDFERTFRALIRFRFWKHGKTQVSFPDNSTAAAVSYITTYATEYAAEYAKDKNLPLPIWRCSRLGVDWYKAHQFAIARGDLRTLPLGKDYSISMPRYRLAKYRDCYDRLDDFIKNYPVFMREDFDKCLVLNPDYFRNSCVGDKYIAKPSELTLSSVIESTFNSYSCAMACLSRKTRVSEPTKRALKFNLLTSQDPSDLSRSMSSNDKLRFVRSLSPLLSSSGLLDDFEIVDIHYL